MEVVSSADEDDERERPLSIPEYLEYCSWVLGGINGWGLGMMGGEGVVVGGGLMERDSTWFQGKGFCELICVWFHEMFGVLITF